MRRIIGSRLLGGIAVGFVILAGSVGASGKVIYVDADAPGVGNGASWENAYNFLQDALADAGSSAEAAEIRVAAGVYTPDSSSAAPDGTSDRDATFRLIDGGSLKGGFAGYGAADPDVRDVNEYATALSGDLSGDDEPNFVNYGENSYHVVSLVGGDAGVVVDGLAITAGSCDGPDPCDRGSGVYNDGGTLTLVDCTINSNLARGTEEWWQAYCSGIYNYQGTITLTGCSIRDNLATVNVPEEQAFAICSGLFNEEGTAFLNSCVISNNRCIAGEDSGWTVAGSAVFNVHGSITLEDCAFTGNQAVGGRGGGYAMSCLYNGTWRDAEATLRRCTFTGNLAKGWTETPDGPIACVLNYLGKSWWYDYDNDPCGYLTLTDCTFSQNQVVEDNGREVGIVFNGGIWGDAKAYLTMNGCVVANNIMTISDGLADAGFVYNDASGSDGFSEAHAEIVNCSIVNNLAIVESGVSNVSGLYSDDARREGQTSFKVTNSIVAGHYDGGGMMHEAHGTFTEDSSYNFVGVAEDGFSNLSSGAGTLYGTTSSALDPCFASAGLGDYHLKSQAGRWNPDILRWVRDMVSSPCIDAGDPTSPVGNELFPNGGVLNMGAYGGTVEASKSYDEFPPRPPKLVDASDGLFPDRIRVRWSAVSEAEQYRLYRSESLSEPRTPLGGWRTGRFFNDESGEQGKSYFYWVRARNFAGASRFSRPDEGWLRE